jgi:hypothetical protein
VVLLAVLLDDQLGHALSDGHAVALAQLQDVLEGQPALGVGVALVQPSHCLLRQRLPPLLRLLAAQHVQKSGGGDVGIGASQSAQDAVVLAQRPALAEELGGGSDCGHWHLLGEFVVEEGDEAGRGGFGEGLAPALGLGGKRCLLHGFVSA